MPQVRIAHAEPRPGRQPGGGFRISSFLVVLADDSGGRALPVWLIGPEGHGLWEVLGAPGDSHHLIEAAETLTSRMLQGAGVQVTGVEIDELDPALTSGPQRGRSDVRPVARIEFTQAGTAAPQQMRARLGYALALAAAAGAPVRVADQVMDRLAVTVHGEDLLREFLGDDVPRPGEQAESEVPRFAPRNLTFADGLAGWEFGGSFRDPDPDAAGYRCAAEAGVAVVASATDKPEGAAALAQSVLVHEYVGRTVTFRAEIRTEDVADEAGLHLLGGMPTGPVSLEKSLTAPMSGSNDWTGLELSATVAEHGGMVQFGVFLRGPGRVEFRNPGLTFTPGPARAAGGNLLALPLGGAFFREGGGAFHGVGGGEDRGDDLALAGEGGRAVPVSRLDDDALGGRESQRGVLRDPAGQFPGGRQRLASRDDDVYQAGLAQALGGVVAAGQRDFHGQVIRYAARQPEQAARARHQAALDLGQAELGLVAGHHQVAGQRELEPAGQRVAFYCGDDRLARRLLHDAAEAAAGHDRGISGKEALQVHAGAERAASAGQDQYPHVIPAVQVVDGGRDTPGYRAVNRVPGLGPVDGDDGDTVAYLG
jgi:bifunctional DNase/RNase